VRGAINRQRAQEDGLDVVVDTEHDDVVDAVRAATNGRGADRAVDTVGPPILNAVIAAMGFSGGICIMTAPGPRRTDFDTLDFYRRELRLRGLNTTTLTVNEVAATLRTALSEIERAQLPAPRITTRYELDEAAAAYGQVAVGNAGGRVILLPRPPAKG